MNRIIIHTYIILRRQNVYRAIISRSGTRLFLLRMLSAWGLLMYCSTICFHRLLHNHPLKKLCTFLILRISMESWTLKVAESENIKLSLDCLREYDVPVPPSNEPVLDPPYDVNGRSSFFNVNTYYKGHPKSTVSNGIFNLTVDFFFLFVCVGTGEQKQTYRLLLKHNIIMDKSCCVTVNDFVCIRARLKLIFERSLGVRS